MPAKTKIEKIPKRLIKTNQLSLLKKQSAIKEGATLLQKGEVVAFPTETVYGLGAAATNSRAVAKIFKAKGRPQDNPLIVHIGSRNQLKELVKGDPPTQAEELMEAFWPGPLTVILPKNNRIPDRTTAGLETVGIRMPSHPVALALIQTGECPVAAPSANSSGYPSPTKAEHVYQDLKSKIPFIIDGGPCAVGVESTVVTVGKGQTTILRPGGITREKIEKVIGERVKLSSGIKDKTDTVEEQTKTPRSPGVKYKHYSPATPVKLIKPINPKTIIKFCEKLRRLKEENITLVLTKESKNLFEEKSSECLFSEDKVKIISMGSSSNPTLIAQNIFAILREQDRTENELIIVETIPEKGLGEAIMNRLHKAAADYIYFN